jgi:hypothetical protein
LAQGKRGGRTRRTRREGEAEIVMKGSRTVKQRGRQRRRKAVRNAKPRAVPVMVAVMIGPARKIIVFAFLVWTSMASATTYYVSSSTGSDANSGTSSGAAWQTIAHVNGQTFLAGDSILFKRGDVWNESLAPGSSGSSGNPITFDAYGTGAAPNLTGYYAVPATSWVLVTGNAWKAALPAGYTTINFCLFGSIWGQKVSAVSSNLTAQWDFYLANGFIYVYSQGNPTTYYNEAIVPMALSNVPVINVNGKSWLTFQHFLVNWFDQYGVYVQGASDHLVFANMESDSMIPQGTQPLGFYVNESAPGPGDIRIYNSEAHLNYDGFRFDGVATAISMVNDKGYANRDGALVDNTGAVTYSYCHFYASSLAVAGSTDVEWTSGTGPIAGAGNIAADTAPAVQVYQRYPAEVTLTVDDAGMTPGADTYYASTVLPLADAASVPVGVAITVGYPLAGTLVSEFQGWINAGRDVTSHSMSHTYYTNTDALDIQYSGTGTAATLSIAGKTLTITVTGASDSVSYNLGQGQPQGTILGLQQALAATGKYSTSYLTPCQGPYGTGCSAYTAQALLAQDLADVSGQDVRSAVYHILLDVTRLTTDEITLSRQWMTTNLTGLPATPVYVYPGGYETTTMQGITAGVPYTGARGALKEDLGVLDTYADGFNLQNVTSFGVNPSWQGLTAASLNQKIQALVWKESVWGVPWGIFWHLNELSSTEITNLIQDFKAGGATVRTNTGLVNWLHAGTQETGTDGNYYYKLPATSMVLDFRPTKNSPVVDAGQNLGGAYALDINGVNQNSYGSGWEIGAHVYQGYATYGVGTGPGAFTIGLGLACPYFSPYACVPDNVSTAFAPSNIPFSGLLGAGTYVSQPEPAPGNPLGIDNSPMLRVTDYNTISAGHNDSVGPQCSGASTDQMFNTTSTWFNSCSSGGEQMFWQFNAASHTATLGFVGAANNLATEANFSSVNANLIYYMGNAATGTALGPKIFTQNVTSPGVASQFYDFSANCSSWPGGTITWEDRVVPNYNDTLFSSGLSGAGGQGTGRYVVAYVAPGGFTTSGCYWINTATGQMFGPSGLIGQYGVSHGTFTIHGAATGKGNTVEISFANADTMSISAISNTGGVTSVTYTTSGNSAGVSLIAGETVTVTGNTTYAGTFTVTTATSSTATWAQTCTGCASGSSGTITVGVDNGLNSYLWVPGASDLVSQCLPVGGGSHCGGHGVLATNNYFNNYTYAAFAERPISNPSAPSMLFPSPQPCSGIPGGAVDDFHPATQYSPGDTTYIIGPSSTESGVSDYSWPCQNEVLGFSLGNNVKRFAHTYTTPTWFFNSCDGGFALSQDGEYALISSTMSNSLGNIAGGSTVTAGTVCSGPKNGTGGNARSDLFLVYLQK